MNGKEISWCLVYENMKNVTGSSVSDVKSSRSEKKKKSKKQRMERDIESGNAEKEAWEEKDERQPLH
ncbi:hypothetical protein V6N13_147238 [Hibiscus sabdariffa]